VGTGACSEVNHSICWFFSHEIMCHVNLVSGQPSYVYIYIVTKYTSAHYKMPVVIVQICYKMVLCFYYRNLPSSFTVHIGAVQFSLAEYCSVLIL
jgi:hypothetical protein